MRRIFFLVSSVLYFIGALRALQKIVGLLIVVRVAHSVSGHTLIEVGNSLLMSHGTVFIRLYLMRRKRFVEALAAR